MRGQWMAVVGLTAALNFSSFAAPAPSRVEGDTPAAQLEKGIFQQETAGDLDAAVKVYKQIVDEANANRRFVAEAQFRIAACYQKQGKKSEAEAALRQVVVSYPDQAELVTKARKELGETGVDKKAAENLAAEGWAHVGEAPPALKRDTARLFGKSMKILGTCIREAPEFAARKRRIKKGPSG